jgi:hypothetical protein
MGSSLLPGPPPRATPTVAPVPFASPGMRRSFGGTLLRTRNRGAEAQMRAMGTNGTLFAIVDRIITSYSQVEWKLYRKARSGLKKRPPRGHGARRAGPVEQAQPVHDRACVP